LIQSGLLRLEDMSAREYCELLMVWYPYLKMKQEELKNKT